MGHFTVAKYYLYKKKVRDIWNPSMEYYGMFISASGNIATCTSIKDYLHNR